jgi:DNA-binding transcriptional MerR regulator
MSTPQSTKRLLPTRQVGARYGVTPRTVDRWKRRKMLPPPDLTINNRHYWYEDGLDQHDRQLVAERASAPRKIDAA